MIVRQLAPAPNESEGWRISQRFNLFRFVGPEFFSRWSNDYATY